MTFSTGDFVVITNGFFEGQKAVVESKGEGGYKVRLVTDMHITVEAERLKAIAPETLDDVGHAMKADQPIEEE